LYPAFLAEVSSKPVKYKDQVDKIFSYESQLSVINSIESYKSNFATLKKDYDIISKILPKFKTPNVTDCIKFVDEVIKYQTDANNNLEKEYQIHTELTDSIISFFSAKTEREDYESNNHLVDTIMILINTLFKSYYNEKLAYDKKLEAKSKPKIIVKPKVQTTAQIPGPVTEDGRRRYRRSTRKRRLSHRRSGSKKTKKRSKYRRSRSKRRKSSKRKH
jgi:hypothetical protein